MTFQTLCVQIRANLMIQINARYLSEIIFILTFAPSVNLKVLLYNYSFQIYITLSKTQLRLK